MYKELVGGTAIRKSSKIKDMIEEFAKRLPRVSDKEGFVNYCYFLARLQDFELAHRIPNDIKNSFIQRSIESTMNNINDMSLDNVLRHFGDLSVMDPAVPLANKITELIKASNENNIHIDN